MTVSGLLSCYGSDDRDSIPERATTQFPTLQLPCHTAVHSPRCHLLRSRQLKTVPMQTQHAFMPLCFYTATLVPAFKFTEPYRATINWEQRVYPLAWKYNLLQLISLNHANVSSSSSCDSGSGSGRISTLPGSRTHTPCAFNNERTNMAVKLVQASPPHSNITKPSF